MVMVVPVKLSSSTSSNFTEISTPCCSCFSSSQSVPSFFRALMKSSPSFLVPPTMRETVLSPFS